jgi:hypothetical protein
LPGVRGVVIALALKLPGGRGRERIERLLTRQDPRRRREQTAPVDAGWGCRGDRRAVDEDVFFG